MADFEIGPERPAVGGGVSIPDLAAPYRANQQSFEQASDLFQRLGKQYEDQQAASALISYKQKLTGLDEQVAGIADPHAKIDIYKAGIDSIQGDLQKEYPNLNLSAIKSIQYEMANDLHNHIIRTTTQAHDQAIKDLGDFSANTVALAKDAKSKSEQDALLANALNHYKQSVANGVISPEQGKLFSIKAVQAVHAALADKLADEHPDEFLQTTPEQLGISQAKWNAGRTHAAKKKEDEEAAGTKAFKEKKDQLLEEMYAHPENAQAIADHYPTLKGFAELATGHPIVLGIDKVEQDAADQMENARSEDEIEKIYRHARAQGVIGTDLSIVRSDSKSRLKTESGTHMLDLKEQLKEYTDKHTPFYIQGTPDAVKYRQFKGDILGRANVLFKEAKTIKEMDDAFTKLKGDVTKEYGSKAATPDTKPTTETENKDINAD